MEEFLNFNISFTVRPLQSPKFPLKQNHVFNWKKVTVYVLSSTAQQEKLRNGD